MRDDTLGYVRDTVEDEGFWYAFSSYSDFTEVKDPEFHKLRTEFLEAAEKLADYLILDFSEL